MELVEPQAARALVVTAHPDDVDFLASGTVALLRRRGCRVTYLVSTNGGAGQASRADDALGRTRACEQDAAAEALGVSDVRFLDARDGRVCDDRDLVMSAVSAVLDELRPDLVLTHSPEFNWAHFVDSHPDHRAVGEATLTAMYPGHPERPAVWRVPGVWLFGAPNPTIAVDITSTWGMKQRALAQHASQIDDVDVLMETVAARQDAAATAASLADGAHAELFQAISLPR